MTSETQRELKVKFAEALLQTPNDPYAAAFSVCKDTGLALQIARDWSSDSEVQALKLGLIEKNGLRPYLANKEQQAKDIYEIATKSGDEEIKLKAHRLYAEIMGHVEKPVPPTQVTTNVQTCVMLVPVHASDEEWEATAVKQQRTLTAGAHENRTTENVQ